MKFRGLTTEGDWKFGAGRQSYAIDNDAIILNIETTLKTFLSECFFDTQVGLPWFDLIDSKNKDIIVLAIKSALVECYGVLRVTEIEYTWSSARELIIKYWIDTIFFNRYQGTVTI